jgi:prevent-host-death family protein
MKTIDLKDASGKLADYARAAATGTVIVTERGKPVAAVMSLKGVDWETASLSTNPRFIEIINESRRSGREDGTISMAEIQAEIGLNKRVSRRSQKSPKIKKK